MIKTSFFLVFILVHLIGDFVLQTNKIAILKATSVKGIFMHVSIILIIQILGLSIFGINGIAAGAICGAVHFFIDYLKFSTKKYFENLEFAYFIFDQILHVTVILLLTLIFETKHAVLSDQFILIVKLLICIIIVTYISSVSVKIFLRDLDSKIKNDIFFKRNERIIDALIGIALWFIYFFPVSLSILLNIVPFFFYQKYQRIQYKYENKLIITKYIMLALISYLVYQWWKLPLQ